MPEKPAPDPDEHAVDFGRRWADRLDEYCALRMQALGIPDDKNGADDPYRGIPWRAFEPEETAGGHLTTGITVNSGVLNPDLLKGGKGGRL